MTERMEDGRTVTIIYNSINSISQLSLVMETGCIFFDARTGFLIIIYMNFVLQRVKFFSRNLSGGTKASKNVNQYFRPPSEIRRDLSNTKQDCKLPHRYVSEYTEENHVESKNS
jgi:hypothetical protein